MDVKAYGEALASAQEEGIEIDIKTPDGDAIGLKIRVAGPDSKRQKAARARIVNARLRQRASQTVTADMVEAESRRVMAQSTIDWEFGVGADGTECTIGGEKPECTVENAHAVYTTYPFIYEQVANAAGERAGFIKT